MVDRGRGHDRSVLEAGHFNSDKKAKLYNRISMRGQAPLFDIDEQRPPEEEPVPVPGDSSPFYNYRDSAAEIIGMKEWPQVFKRTKGRHAGSPDSETSDNKLLNLGAKDWWSKGSTSNQYKRYRKAQAHSLERYAQDTSIGVLGSLKNLNSPKVDVYRQRVVQEQFKSSSREKQRREIETESTLGLNQVYKPSALKLFPTIGMLTNEETYTTSNVVDQQPV